jgi:hypothetical protein
MKKQNRLTTKQVVFCIKKKFKSKKFEVNMKKIYVGAIQFCVYNIKQVGFFEVTIHYRISEWSDFF